MFALSKSEVRRILDAIDLTSPFGRRDYLMVLFMYHTGLRVGETSGLVIDLVDHDRYPRQYLHLPAAICKNSRGRVIPLNEVAQVCVVKLLTFYQQIPSVTLRFRVQYRAGSGAVPKSVGRASVGSVGSEIDCDVSRTSGA